MQHTYNLLSASISYHDVVYGFLKLLEILKFCLRCASITYWVNFFGSFIVIVLKYDKQSVNAVFAGVPYSEHSSFIELREFVQVWFRNSCHLSYPYILLDKLVWYHLQCTQITYIHHVLALFICPFTVFEAWQDYSYCQYWYCC